jgi:hypothetical protein
MYEKDGGRLKGSFAGSEERSGTASRFRADRLGVSPKAYTIPYKLWGMLWQSSGAQLESRLASSLVGAVARWCLHEVGSAWW